MDGLPSGQGKYMWADGSCYMGSWIDGKPDGDGIYSWASGAFYEGTWKQGCMEGEGTYSDGYIGTFTGSWHDHKMHGCAPNKSPPPPPSTACHLCWSVPGHAHCREPVRWVLLGEMLLPSWHLCHECPAAPRLFELSA
jgi:hypothetical protein